jgi:hypothetical protein
MFSIDLDSRDHKGFLVEAAARGASRRGMPAQRRGGAGTTGLGSARGGRGCAAP